MAMRHEHLTADELRRQADLDASYTSAQRRLRDRPFMARLRRRLAALDTESRAPRLTKDQFLDQTPLDR
jgi:hypothetical protein